MAKLENAKQKPTVYYAKHIERGLVGYNDLNLFVDDTALGNMCKSMIGCPVYVNHQTVNIEDIEKADGYITDSFYNEKDGWWWCKFVIVTDEGKEKIDMGWGVSNAYVPTEFGEAGVWHNLDYDKKLLNGYYTHLAVVENPRYEDVMIYTLEAYKEYNKKLDTRREELINEKNGGQKIMFFRKKQIKENVELKNTDDLTDVMIEVDGAELPLLDVINTVKNAKNEEEEKEKEKINEDTKIDVDGKEMTIKELVSAYKQAMSKKNEDDEEEKKEEVKDKKNSKENEEVIKEEKPEHFNELKNADKKTNEKRIIETSMNKEQRGRSRYGSNK